LPQRDRAAAADEQRTRACLGWTRCSPSTRVSTATPRAASAARFTGISSSM